MVRVRSGQSLFHRCRRLLFLAGFVGAGGCYSPSPGDGQILCGTDGSCPSGFRCAGDHACWREGHGPTFDLRASDRASFDLATAPADDLATAPADADGND